MSYPLDNLGDYNKVRIDLQNANGNRELLYKQIGDIAVAKESPYIFAYGAIAGVVLAGACWVGKKGLNFLRNRREKIASEAEVKEKFIQETRAVQSEEKPDNGDLEYATAEGTDLE